MEKERRGQDQSQGQGDREKMDKQNQQNPPPSQQSAKPPQGSQHQPSQPQQKQQGGKPESKEGPEKLLDERFNQWKTPLQRHVAYFDMNGDGFISPYETFQGMRKLGYSLLMALLGVLVIHSSMSYPTCDSFLPDPLFRINIKNIGRAKHGSDSGVYDFEGNFNEEKFKQLLSKYDKDHKGGVSYYEGLQMMRDRRNIYDFFGWFAETFEWGFTYALLANEKKVVSADIIRSMFDGTLFFEMEKRNRQQAQQQSQSQQAK